MSNDIDTINDLIATVIDSVDGYEKAAAVADRPNVKQLFLESARDRRHILSDLRSEIIRQGGTPADDGTLLAAAHRKFMDLAAAFEKDDRAAAQRVESGEDYIRAKFEKALEADDLSIEARHVVQSAHARIAAAERLSDRLAAG